MTQATHSHTNLSPILVQLNQLEKERLSPSATFSTEGLRRHSEDRAGYRQSFALDADRIIHSRAYTRYIDKTQVFCLVSNDHITHRVLHVQLVSRISRTIGRFLHLNEDLIEAIALGHDIGHPPFGHDGEHFLAELCIEYGLPPFQHNIQSVRFLDHLERKGRGWNLTLQTLDGILCHDGEIHLDGISPNPGKDFARHDLEIRQKQQDPTLRQRPMTLEACVVRMADTVAYIGRDIEDAILLNLIKRSDIPESCRSILGNSNGEIVYTLVTDLIANSYVPDSGESGNGHISFSKEVGEQLRLLKQFNYKNIYLHPRTKTNLPIIKKCYRCLFKGYLSHLKNDTIIGSADLMRDMNSKYLDSHSPESMVCDYISGMTDDYFIKQASAMGCEVPDKQ